ncbi:nucleotide-binding domain-containing protein [Lepidopterella palustris CBS 459.81]|uniref:Nucleotide-binding domain-containing protein n=1 Tax=Lepidopterella palustris CBS 459.81 TaxID=1314670 RepID=A0A8E2DZ67_9PEZI|nr:nucleotide-binding domain-containing protein [Lepidopterella palustris CBS 459.81]
MTHVVVIGAGVIGLQTAVSLLDAGYRVTIVAEHYPGDSSVEYTSMWAGAQWRTHATKEQEESKWDIESYWYWMGVIERGGQTKDDMGVEVYPSYFYWANQTPESASRSSIWFADLVRNFAFLPPTALPPNTYAGIRYDSIAINPPKYLAYLYSRARTGGATTIREKLPTDKGMVAAIEKATSIVKSVESTYNDVDIAAFINCTGLAAGTLVPDPDVYPIKGETLLVRINDVFTPTFRSDINTFDPTSHVPAIFTHVDEAIPSVTYIIPRPGTITYVLGGTKEPDNWDTASNAGTLSDIQNRCRALWPALEHADFKQVASQVGLRPGRRGGARVELEEVQLGRSDGSKEGRKLAVIHHYGHAGAGYQNSIGSARKVVGLVGEVFGKSLAEELMKRAGGGEIGSRTGLLTGMKTEDEDDAEATGRRLAEAVMKYGRV